MPLKSAFARLYSLSSLKWISVNEMVKKWRKGECNMESTWQRRLRAWEEEEWARIENTLENINLTL